jgi:transcriptional regulator GlxA family with amidase domain
MERVIAFIHQEHHRELSVMDMADIAQLSRAHFIRIFTQWTGQPPGGYLQRSRIDHARSLLASSPDLPIKRIATESGFKNPYHFSRVFRKFQGLSPQHYRETLRGS